KARCEAHLRVHRRALVWDVDATRVRPLPARLAREMAPWLRAEPRVLADDPVLRRTSAEIVGAETNPYYQAVRLYDFVRDLDYQLTLQDRGDREVLASRLAQCADAAGLLVSLARSQGLPARYLAGSYLRPEEPVSHTLHAWAEIYVHPFGWLPFDPTQGRFAERRLARLGQLDPFYVALWQGRDGRGFSISGVDASSVQVALRFESEDTRVPPEPTFQVPRLEPEAPPVQSFFPAGRAGELLQESFRRLAQGDPAGAVGAARQAAEQAPDNPVVYRQWMLAARQQGQTEAYRQEVEELLARRPDPVLHYALALALTEQGQYSSAWDHLGQAGEGFAVHHARAELLTRTHQPSRALAEMQEAFRQASGARSLVGQMVDLLAELGDWAALERATSQVEDPDPILLLARAQALFRLGRRPEARALIDRARQLDPGNGVYLGVLGWLYLLEGDRGEATSLLRQSLALDLDQGNREFFEDLLKDLGRRPGRRGGSWP
ncbi:MAG TPA: transglutaminase domain-containing protein, partial [Candidatus Nitrosotenuis sp.]|nr:transglutaminase domain-containing protein [Candidatus Nitrosotenuis sp.]